MYNVPVSLDIIFDGDIGVGRVAVIVGNAELTHRRK